MVTTANQAYADRMKLLRQHGMSVSDRVRHQSSKIVFEDHLEVGYNYRMTDIQAAVGIKQLEKLDWIVEERRKIAKRYLEGLKDIDCIRLPVEGDGKFSNIQSFSLYLKDNCPIERNNLMQELLDRGISSRRGIMTTNRETAYASENISLPISEDLSDRSIILPLYVGLTESETNIIINVLKSLIHD